MALSKAWAFQRKVLRQVHNKRVVEYFGDLPELDDDELSTGRRNLKAACLIGAQDSQNLALIKIQTYLFIINDFQNKPDIYGIPVHDYESYVRFKPQITLYFAQDLASVPEGGTRVGAELTIRINDETSATMNETKARALANRVRSEFALGGGFRWRKGREKVVYRDVERGNRFTVFAYNDTEAKEVITKALQIKGETADWDNLIVATPQRNFPTTPPLQTIYGKQRRAPLERPIVYVRFKMAVLQVHGIKKGIVLVDLTGRRNDALVGVN